jgi:hypothetical protein
MALSRQKNVFFSVHQLYLGIDSCNISNHVLVFFSPVHDLGNNVEFDSVYQSVHRQAGITFSRSDFPLGFFVVLIVRPGM